MKHLLVSLFILANLWYANTLIAQTQPAYLRSTVGHPWGSTTNDGLMNDVFGVGNWSDLRYETVDVNALFSNHTMIFMEGSDDNANELEVFLDNNRVALETWVSNGGNLFLNSAPNEGNGMSYGFGGINLVYGGNNTGTATAFDVTHPIFNGPFLPVLTNWSGNSFAHATVTGPGMDTLIVDVGNSARVIVAQKQWGAGRVIFGGMTTVNYHSPSTEAYNLRRNILDVLKFNPVPLDAGIVSIDSPSIFCVGMHDIEVTLANLGLDTLFDVTINWEFNGLPATPFLFNTPLDTFGSGNNTTSVLLGTENFVAGQLYTIKAWTTNPNGMADTVNFNDTSMVVVSPGLAGNYTIGGVTPDYNTFTEAVADLNAFGVCDSVTFNVRNGTYNEQLEFGSIAGAGANSPVIFQSESGDSSQVILSFFNSSSLTNYTINLNGVDWLTLRGMTLEATGTTYSRVISMIGDVEHFSLENNIIRSTSTTSTSTNRSLVFFTNNTVNEFLSFRNNVFQNGSRAFYFNGTPNGNNYLDGLEVVDNEFIDQYHSGMYLAYHKAALITGNLIETSSNYTSFLGIHLYRNYEAPNISDNRIFVPLGYRGILVDEIYGSVADPCLITNNYISIGGTNTSYGIYSEDGTYQNIFYNTIRLNNTGVSSRPLSVVSGNNKVVLNNILANFGGGLAFYTNTPSAIASSDYNDLYTTGPILGFWSNNQADLATWQANTGQDLNSYSVDPLFVNAQDYTISEILLNEAALSTPVVSEDIEGETRNASPDIGADEWTPPTTDAHLVNIQSPQSPFAAGNQSINVLLKNNGSDSLFTADIEWTFDSLAQSTFNWSGALGSGDTTTVAIGNMAFVINEAYDIRAWVTNPNGGMDPVGSNDTTEVNDLYVGLGGTYTIGGMTPDFNTFGEAVTNLNQGGLVAATTFNVRNGTYNEQLTFVPILGASADRPIRFQSESGDSTQVILTNASTSAANFTVYFNGVDWLTFAQMTLEATNNTYGRVAVLTGASNRVRLENNILRANPTTTTSTNRALIYSTSSFVNDSFQLYHNHLLNGSSGLYFRASGSHASGTELVGNTFENQYYRAIDMDEHNRPVITDNLIQTNTTYTDYTGLYSNDSNLGAEIRRNRIFANTHGAGMRLFDMTGNSSNQAWITNNFIEIGGNQANTVYGIQFSSGNFHQLHYNSVQITSTGINAAACYSSGGSSKRMSNNIWSNIGGGQAFYSNSPGSFLYADHNNFYTTGPNIIFWGSSLWSTLEVWRNGGNTGEVNSISVNPFFLGSFDYRTGQSALNGAANPLPEVLVDIEGETRDTLMPDIGADEFTLPQIDAGVNMMITPAIPFPVGNQLIKAVLRNHGSDTLESVTINWAVNGAIQPPINWTGTLLGNDTVSLDLNSVNFQLNQAYDLEAWTSNPNGGADPLPVNDSTAITNLYAGLTGAYTIGGLTPDFPDFTSAVNVLNSGGVVGPVTFNVRDGVYSEQLLLFDFPGSDSLRQVAFQSESGDSTAVTLSLSTGSANNYLVLHDGTRWLTWRQITFESLNASYTRQAVFRNGAQHVNFEQNYFKAPVSSSTTTNRALVYLTASTVMEHIRFKQNHFSGGSQGIYYQGNANANIYTRGVEIDDNLFENHYYRGVYVYRMNHARLRNNTFIATSTYSNIRGFDISLCYFGLEMTGNRVIGQNTGIGIFLDDVYGTTSESVLLANNFVQMGGTATVQGIYLDNGSYHKILHNSVNLTNTNSGSFALYNRSGNDKQIFNNILANPGGGQTLYNNSSSATIFSNHNDLYTTGPTLGVYANVTYNDLASWQAATNRDTNSVTVDPLFVSDTDLHVTNVVLDKLGQAFPEVPVDIDGEFRDPALPDIGADEFFTAPEDASLVSINSPQMPFAADLQSIFVTLLNNGLDTLESVTLYWEINGTAQAPFNWTGSLLSGETIDSVNLGNFTFELDTAYTIRAWTSMPNGMTDPENFNDTSSVNNLYAALGGVYTLGGANPNFINFNHAATTLANGGVIAPVTFNVRSGTYDEQVSFSPVLGASATNPITFQSEVGDSSQVTLSNANTTSTDNYIVQLNGADWFRFRQLTFQNTSTVYSRVFYLINGASQNEWTNNVIIGPNLSSTSTNLALVYSLSSDDEYNVFRHNKFLEGSYGIYLIGVNSANAERGTVIEYNDFIGQYYMGVRFLYQDAPRVAYNTFEANSIYCCTYYGVYSNSNQNAWTYLGNSLTNIDHGYGFYFTNSDGAVGARGLLANNFVSIGQGTSRASYGIYLTASDYNDIYHNSVRVESSNANSRAFHLAGNEMRVKNNVFANFDQGYAYYKQSGNNLETDFNDLYAPSIFLGYWDGNNAADINAWQNLSGQAASSIKVDPRFASPIDLHADEVDLNNTGTPLAQITTDFDGEARNPITPDIGADEFTPVTTHDAEVLAIISPNKNTPFPEGVQSVVVEIKNNGADTLLNVDVDWAGNGLPQLTYNWSGFLRPGERDTLTLGSFNFNVGFGNDLLAYTSNPNGQVDNNPANDTTSVQGLFPALLGEYTIGGSFPDFASFSAAAVSLNNGGILAPVTFNVRNGTYNEQISLGPINGSSAANTILFQSENGDNEFVRLEHANSSGNNYVVQLDGADYVTFQNMTFRSLGSFARIFHLRNGADHIRILNNELIAANGDDNYQLIYSPGNIDQNLLIQNNRFVDGGYGVYLIGQNTSQLESGTRVLNNVFEGQNRYGIYLYYQNAPEVLDNQITTNSTRSDFHGIFMRHCDNGFELERNRVIGGYGYGLHLNRCDANIADRASIANNFIQVGGSSAAYGIYVFDGQFLNFNHNSVHLTNTDPNSRAFYNTSGANKNVLNNIFANTGGGLAYYASTSLASSNFNDLYSTGPNLGYWLGTTVSDLAGWQAAAGRDFNSVSANPLFYSDTDLHVLQVALDSAATAVGGLTMDIDGEMRNASFPDIGADEFDFLEDDLGIIAVLDPQEACDMGNSETVKVVIQNYGGLAQSGFEVVYRNGAMAPVMENVGALTVQPGDTAHYTFSTPADLSSFIPHPIETYTLLAGDLNVANDTFNTTVQNYQTPAVVGNMLPADGAIDLDPPLNFSWLPAAGALRYDLYLWEDGQMEPDQPIGQDLTQITFAYNSNNFIFGATYNWKIVAKNNFCETEGPTQSFTLRELPDLIVNNVQTIASPFSGQTIEVTWEVENQAIGSTGMTQWFDYVYLSSDNVYQPNIDTYLGGFPNLTALNSMESYSQMQLVTLPQGIQGDFYLFVVTDRINQLIEGFENNNVGTPAQLLINLTPPADLVVSSIITPNNAFSGSTIDVTWTVMNQGLGDINGGSHRDYIFISQEPNYNPATAIFLGSEPESSGLMAGQSYTDTRSVTLPASVFGDYFIHVYTDFQNRVYEYVFEDNNDETSDTLNIILTPPPDLQVSNIVMADSVDNRATVNIVWRNENQGATPVTDNFSDRIYISTADVYDPDSVSLLKTVSTNLDIDPGNFINRSTNVTIPNSVCDTQYFYIFTDFANQVFEHTNEDNNVGRSGEVIARNADVIVSDIIVADTTNSGETIIVQWTVKNQGQGDVVNFNRVDAIYLSTDPMYDPNTATFLANLSYGGLLVAGQSFNKQKDVTLPDGISGNHYFHVRTDTNNSIFEKDREDNNVSTDSSFVKLSPWPDLQVDTLLGLPDTANAGDLLTLDFVVRNYGAAAVEGTGTWKDRIYISPNPTWNPADAVSLQTLDVLQPVAPMASYTESTSFVLPMLGGGAASGICYIYVFTDVTDVIFENTDEGNNVKRSNPISVSAPDPVDFAILNATSLPDTLSSGELANLQWMIQNQGNTTALWSYPLWYDGIYLSLDSILDKSTDLFVVDYTRQGPLGNLEMYSNNQSFNIPNGIEGDYYVFLVADHTEVTNDETPANSVRLIRPNAHPNGMAMPVHIELTPSPDLQVSTLVAPTAGTAGQPVQVIWTVENNGLGNTSGTWTDKVYLSTDFDIDNSDPIIGTENQSRVIAPGGSYTDTLDVFIPIDAVGNFVLILRTDANNAVFELDGEDNNTFFSFITTTLPLPSDLIVENLSFDSMAMVGEPFPVSYDLFNQGLNPATGFMQDLVYLSADSLLDVSDVKHIGPISRNINLAPNSNLSLTPSDRTPGVPLGEYYVIVQTDILNNIFENSDTNNVAISPQKVTISVAELPLDVVRQKTLFNNEGIYYRIEIPDSLSGETMLVTMDALGTLGVNELFLSYGQVPTRSVHDFAFSDPFASDQEIIVPELEAGTYYLLGYGVNNGAALQQTVDFKAEIIPFQIRNVESTTGGNTGNVTLKIEGAKFTPTMDLEIFKAALGGVSAHKLTFINSTKVFATFNLAGANLGVYDLIGTKPMETSTLPDGFEVVDGGAGTTTGSGGGGFFCNIVNVGSEDNLSKNIQHPARIRVNRLVPITIQFGNNGNVDIPCPFRWLLSMRGAPLSIDPDNFDEESQELYIEFQEPSGPPGVLRPGATSAITVYSYSSHPLRFILKE